MNVTAPFLPTPTLRCDEIGRVLGSLHRAEEALARLSDQVPELRMPRRRKTLESLVAETQRHLHELRDHLRKSESAPAVLVMQRLSTGMLQTLSLLALPEEIVHLSPGGAANLGGLLPGLGVALCGPTLVNSLRMATRARTVGEQSAALAWSLQASLEGLAEAVSCLESVVSFSAAPPGANLQIALLVLQVGSRWSSEMTSTGRAA